jgi:protein ImuB
LPQKALPLDGGGLGGGWTRHLGSVSSGDSTPPLTPPHQGEGDQGALPCSCPNTPGWRPGARWAREEGAGREPVRRTQNPVRIERSRDARSSEAETFAPLILTARTGNRQMVAAACPAARALGLAPGMAVAQARALVPGLDVGDADAEADAALLHGLALFAARRWTPRAAVTPPDGLFLDLSGVAHLFGGEEALCGRFIRFCARLGLTARIAVAGTWGAAHALARFSGEAIALCPNGAEAEALAPLPLAALRVEEPVLAAARRLGLETVGDLLQLPRAPLQRRFGKSLLARLDQALGRTAEAVDPVVPEDPPSAILRFAEPIATAEAIAEALGLLMSRLIATLREAGLAARTLDLLCERIDGRVERVAIGTVRATRDRDHLLRLLAMKIERIEPGFGLDSMRLVAGRIEPLAPEQLSPEQLSNEKAPDGLAPLVDRLAGRLGHRRLYRMSAVESDVPERSIRRIGPLASPLPWPKWPRPVRLLSPPERVDNVLYELPDQAPVRFSWRGRLHRIRRADGPERIHGEWWKRRAEAEAVRDYFQVEDEEGARFWLYRRGDGVDSRTGDLSWYLHGVFG